VTIHKSTSVGIIGAGLTGLFAAAQLLRFGIHPALIDQKKGPDRSEEPLWLNRRSVELLDQLGLWALLEPKVRRVETLQLGIHPQEQLALHPFIQENKEEELPIWYEVKHKDLEQMLIQHLTRQACAIHWNTRLIAWTATPYEVQWDVDREGKIETWQCAYMLGADGASGLLRLDQHKPMPQTSTVSTFSRWKITSLPSLHQPYLWTDGVQEILCVPTQEGVVWGAYFGNKLSFSKHQQKIQKALAQAGLDIAEEAITLLSQENFDLHPVFQQGQRCFLMGGAAHGWPSGSHSALQAGWQDATNLSWKLAAVLDKRFQTKILHSYAAERQHQHAYGYLLSHELHSIHALSAWMGNWTKGFRTRNLLQQLKLSPKKEGLAKRWAGHTTHYRYSPLSIQYILGTLYAAGDRLPALTIFDEKHKQYTTLAERNRIPGFILLLLGTLGSTTLQAIGQWVQYRYPTDMHVYYVPYSSANQKLFSIFEVADEAHKMLLIRPDGYLAYINDTVNIGLIDTYMQEVLGLIDHPRFHQR
jgi:2-polyprenyl-6-methoxyphenol hydroxylase-like FAD-dependent oxidoreductase